MKKLLLAFLSITLISASIVVILFKFNTNEENIRFCYPPHYVSSITELKELINKVDEDMFKSPSLMHPQSQFNELVKEIKEDGKILLPMYNEESLLGEEEVIYLYPKSHEEAVIIYNTYIENIKTFIEIKYMDSDLIVPSKCDCDKYCKLRAEKYDYKPITIDNWKFSKSLTHIKDIYVKNFTINNESRICRFIEYDKKYKMQYILDDYYIVITAFTDDKEGLDKLLSKIYFSYVYL